MDPRSLGTIILLMIAAANAGKFLERKVNSILCVVQKLVSNEIESCIKRYKTGSSKSAIKSVCMSIQCKATFFYD